MLRCLSILTLAFTSCFLDLEALAPDEERPVPELRPEYITKPIPLTAGGNAVNIKLEGTNKCLDLTGGQANDGTMLELWDCNGLQNQQWIFGQGTWAIQYAGDPSKCIDNLGGKDNPGNKLGIWSCSGKASQKWGYDGKMKTIWLAGGAQSAMNLTLGLKSPEANLCMDLLGGNQNNGNAIQVWGCNGHSNQRWDIVQQDNAIRIGDSYYNKCIDIPGGKSYNGAQLEIWKCNGQSQQNWIFDESTSRIVSVADNTKCIDAGNMNGGVRLKLWDCNDQPQQKFVHNGDVIQLVANTKMCFDLPGGNTNDQTPIEIWQCNGCFNQQISVGLLRSNKRTRSSGRQSGLGGSIMSNASGLPGGWPPVPPGSLPNLPADMCPQPFYPPIPGHCLTGGTMLDLGFSAGLGAGLKASLNWGQNLCSVGDVNSGLSCEGFWYVYTKIPYVGYLYVCFGNTQFELIPVGDGSKCNPPLPIAKEMLGAYFNVSAEHIEIGTDSTATAWQQAFHFEPGNTLPPANPAAKLPVTKKNEGSDDAGNYCMHTDDCKSYTWNCPANGCTCPTSDPACEARFPPQTDFTFTDWDKTRMYQQSGANVYWKAKQINSIEDVEGQIFV